MKQLTLIALLILFSAPAMAYVGPGLGMGVIGTIFGVLAAVVLAVFGLFWYPLKRRFGKSKAGAEGQSGGPVAAEKEQPGKIGNTVPSRPDIPPATRRNNYGASHEGALNQARDPATTDRTDNPVQ